MTVLYISSLQEDEQGTCKHGPPYRAKPFAPFVGFPFQEEYVGHSPPALIWKDWEPCSAILHRCGPPLS